MKSAYESLIDRIPEMQKTIAQKYKKGKVTIAMNEGAYIAQTQLFAIAGMIHILDAISDRVHEDSPIQFWLEEKAILCEQELGKILNP